MKTKLTLNIEDTVIKKTKAFSKKRNKSISAIVEEYLEKITSRKSSEENDETFSQRFRKSFPAKAVKSYDYKKIINDYREEKYGRK
ncbi:MAG TPA: DUF6364 family protein [Chitinophagaceae bacterium]|nr:DUF6364 family protein [Chitinophagaceae bacterium]